MNSDTDGNSKRLFSSLPLWNLLTRFTSKFSSEKANSKSYGR